MPAGHAKALELVSGKEQLSPRLGRIAAHYTAKHQGRHKCPLNKCLAAHVRASGVRALTAWLLIAGTSLPDTGEQTCCQLHSQGCAAVSAEGDVQASGTEAGFVRRCVRCGAASFCMLPVSVVSGVLPCLLCRAFGAAAQETALDYQPQVYHEPDSTKTGACAPMSVVASAVKCTLEPLKAADQACICSTAAVPSEVHAISV